MIEHYFIKQQTLDRIRACWLGEPIERYVTWLNEQQYAARNVHHRVPILMRFADYAQSHGAKTLADLPDHIQPFVGHWVREGRSRCRNERTRKKVINSVRNPIEQMLRLGLQEFACSGRSRQEHPFLEDAPGFFGYLQEKRGLRPRTLFQYDCSLRSLQSWGSQAQGALATGFERLRHSSWPAMRSEFHLGIVFGSAGIPKLSAPRKRLIPRDLSSCVEAPKRYRLAQIPRSISWDEVGRMLGVVDRRGTVGKRDYAILLLLVTYGLRSREIAALTVDDLDWERERLRVPERKAGHSTAYPLSPIVGEAIVDYLKRGRPKTSERRLFFRFLAPSRPLSTMAISSRATHYLHKAGITVARPGSHTLRHTCVQRLVDAHFSLKTIGDYVGHRSPDSTMIYSKVDVEGLREISLGHGEEVL